MDQIKIEDFLKADLRVATILDASPVENSEKLLKLKVSLGDQERQILAGIAKNHRPEDLINKQIIIVANLEPRELMGMESQGMLLAASGEEGPLLLTTEKPAPNGAKIK